jgi:hypothetical protein
MVDDVSKSSIQDEEHGSIIDDDKNSELSVGQYQTN